MTTTTAPEADTLPPPLTRLWRFTEHACLAILAVLLAAGTITGGWTLGLALLLTGAAAAVFFLQSAPLTARTGGAVALLALALAITCGGAR